MLRETFWIKREEITVVWRQIHSEELHDLFPRPNIRVIKSRRMRWVGHVARVVGRSGDYLILVWKPEGKRPIRRLRCR